MAEKPENWIADLADIQLPALAHNKKQLEVAIDRPASDYALLGHIISRDPGLIIRLFQQLGQSAAHLRETITDPARIISLLGIASVRQLVRTTPNLEDRFKGPALKGLKHCYGRALHSASFAHCLATLRGNPDTAEDMIAGLLQNIGEMALWTRKPGTMNILSMGISRPEQLDFQSLSRFGTCPSDVGASLAERWQLPETVIQAQHFHHSFDANAQLPLLAASLAWEGMRDCQSREMEDLMQLSADLTHLDVELVRARLHRETATAARIAFAAGLPYFADQLLLPPGEMDKTQKKAAPTASKKTRVQPAENQTRVVQPIQSSTNTQNKPTASSPQSEGLSKPTRAAATTLVGDAKTSPHKQTPQRKKSSASKRAIPEPPVQTPGQPATNTTKAVPEVKKSRIDNTRTEQKSPVVGKKPSSLQEKLGTAINDMQANLKLDRVMFAMLTADRSQLRCRLIVEREQSNLGTFAVPASSRNLFSLLIAKPHAIWVNPGNQAKYRPYIPESATPLIHSTDFFIATAIVGGKPIGIFYADTLQQALNENQFKQFNSQCAKITKSFSNKQ